MPDTSKTAGSLPDAVAAALRRLGQNIRTARQRRKLRIEDLADRMGASPHTVASLEKGNPGTSAAAYFAALWALDLLEQIRDVADPDSDEVGKLQESAHSAALQDGRQ